MEEIKVNDGGGLFDSDGIIDTLLTDLNGMIRQIAAGEYVQFCIRVAGMAQKLVELKKGIKNDRQSQEEAINELKRCNDELVHQLIGLPTGDGAADAP